jgi:hypothetical protein
VPGVLGVPIEDGHLCVPVRFSRDGEERREDLAEQIQDLIMVSGRFRPNKDDWVFTREAVADLSYALVELLGESDAQEQSAQRP